MPSSDDLAGVAGHRPETTSSHMMKTTKRGRPFLKDTLDLFATLIVSLDLGVHKQFFRTFHNSFTTDEAAQHLAQLKFSQSGRGPDPRDPSRIVTTTTTTTFSMTRDMAKTMCQHFMDARLIENAADRGSNLFKERGVYVLTPKGLHVLERFITKNGISADPLAAVFSSQPICLKLLHLERRSIDDEIIISQSVVAALFRRFAGRSANYMPDPSNPPDPSQDYHERSKGIPLMDVGGGGYIGRNSTPAAKYCFQAVTALEWLCDFTSIVGRDEAAEMAAHFVRYGLITLVSDKRKGNDSAIIFTVRGSAPTDSEHSNVQPTGEFRCTAKAIYRISDEGRRVARWDSNAQAAGARNSPNTSQTNLKGQPKRPSIEQAESSTAATERNYGSGDSSSTLANAAENKIHRRISMSERMHEQYEMAERRVHGQKESNTDRLKSILEQPALRSLFREFLKGNFCEENLSFWLEVQDFKRKFNITSSAIAAVPSRVGKATPGQAAMEKHHESLIQMAFMIYNMYLAPSSQCELNIDHGLRNELVAYLSEILTDLTGKQFSGRVEPEQAQSLNATQLQTMIRLYDRIQTHVFRLMATDSVPKFIKTPRYMALEDWQGQDDDDMADNDTIASHVNPAMPPGLEEDETEVGRAYWTVSQKANERAVKPLGVPPDRQLKPGS